MSTPIDSTVPNVVVVDPRFEGYQQLADSARLGRIHLHIRSSAAEALKLARRRRVDAWLIAPDLDDMAGHDLVELLGSRPADAKSLVPSSERFQMMKMLKPIAALILSALAVSMPTAARADVTVNSAVSGPVNGDGGTFTVTPTGTISGTGNGIVAQTGNEITTLTVDGVVVTGTAASGVQNSAGSTMSAIGVSGAIQGGWAIWNDGSIGSINNTGLIQGTRQFAILGTANSSVGGLTNSGTIESVQVGTGGTVDIWVTGTVANLAGGVIRSAGRNNLFLNGATTLLTNAGTISTGGINSGHGIEVGYSANLTTAVNSGLVEGDSAMVIRPSSVLGTFTNSGTFRASTYGVWFGSNSGTVSNLAGGLIESTGYAGIYVGGNGSRVASLDNAGTIRGDYAGITTGNVFGFTTLTNSGTISSALGGGAAIEMYHTGTTATLSNSGVISSGAWYGIEAARGTITTLVNSGTISGAVHGIWNGDRNTISTLTNEATGLIHGDDTGLYVSSTTTAPMEVTNAGWITGSNAGVQIVNSRLLKLTNTGTISFTGTNAGPAVLVGPGSVLGVASGTGGEALSSTGAGARLDGTIVNQGTVHYGFTVDNQNLTVSANGGAGTFTNGTLTVTNGNLTFTSGTSTVAAGVSANAGAGTVITDANATVRFIGLANRTANFQSIANSGIVEFEQTTAGSLAFPITGAGSVLKTGTGNLILSGSSNYTGATTVAAGRLSVNGILGNSPVAVLASAQLGGSGSIGGPVSVASGGSLAPGNSIESLATGTATFAAGATFAYEVDSTNPLSLGTAADLLVVNGDLNLDPLNGSLLTVTDLAGSPNPFLADTTIFALINYSGNWNGGLFTYNGNVLADGGLFTVGSQQWMIDYDRTSSTGLVNFTSDYLPSSRFVALTAVSGSTVPEIDPAAAGSVIPLVMGALAMLESRRRRRAERLDRPVGSPPGR